MCRKVAWLKTNGLHCGIAEEDKKKIRLNHLTVVTAVRSSWTPTVLRPWYEVCFFRFLLC